MSLKSFLLSCAAVLAVLLMATVSAQEPQAKPKYTGAFPLREGDMWAKNFPIQSVHYAASIARDVLEKQKDLPGRENLQQWVDTWSKSEMTASGADIGIDYVHPGPAGNLTMAAAILKRLNAPGLVSKATLDATGKIGETLQCQISNVVLEKNGGLSFDRLDSCLPMPIPDNAREDCLSIQPLRI